MTKENDTKDHRQLDDLAPGESYRSINHGSDQSKKSTPALPKRVEFGNSGGYLDTTRPSSLLMHSVLILILASVAFYLSYYLAVGGPSASTFNSVNFNESSKMISTDPATSMKSILSIVAAALGVLFGIIGAVLPIWAVGRLISDAIKIESTHDDVSV